MEKQYSIWHRFKNNPVKTIIFAGIFIRLFVAIVYQHITIYPDSNDYIILAQRLLSFDLSEYGGERSPGYPLLLCLTNISMIGTVVLQCLLGIATLIFTYKTLLLLGVKDSLSLIVTLILNFYFPVIFFEFTILSETLTLFVITFIFYLFFKIITNQEQIRNNIIWLTTAVSFLVLIKPFYIFLPFILFFFLILRKQGFKKVMYNYICIIIFPLFIFFGWSYINKVNTGYFVSTTFYGFNIAQNCVSFAEHTSPEYEEIGEIYARYRDNRISDKEVAMTIWEAYPELQEKSDLSFPDLSKKLYDYSIATIKLNQAAYLKQVFISWCDFWKTSFYWEPQNTRISVLEKPVLYLSYIERIVVQIIKILFVLLIPFNIWLWIRKKRLNASITITIVVFAASILQAFVTYGTNSRFSFPFGILIIASLLINIQEIIVHHRREKAL